MPSCLAAKKTIQPKDKYKQRHRSVNPVALAHKNSQREGDPRDRRGNEDQKTELNEAGSPKGRGFTDDSGNGAQWLRLALEHMIIRVRNLMARQIKSPPKQNDESGQGNTR